MTTNLRLGPLPDTKIVRLTIAVPGTLKEALDRYAELHAKTWGSSVKAADLIPHIVETFLARDKEFRRATRATASSVRSSDMDASRSTGRD